MNTAKQITAPIKQLSIDDLLFPVVDPEPEEQKITFYHDAGHGWYTCDFALARDLGILDKITACSYEYMHIIYLEEDLDAGLLFDALKANNIKPVVKEVYCGMSAMIRNFQSFNKDRY